MKYLTPREKEIHDELLTGKSNLQIAMKLNCTVGNIKFHNEIIYRKLGVKNCRELLGNVLAKQKDEISYLKDLWLKSKTPLSTGLLPRGEY